MLDQYGHWEGDVFFLNEEITTPEGMTVRQIDVSQIMIMEPDISKEDAVEALINGLLDPDNEPESYEGDLIPAICPGCHREGLVDLDDVLKKMPQGGELPQLPLQVHCPDCRDLARN